jgi:SAM-dependent methyltransferase
MNAENRVPDSSVSPCWCGSNDYIPTVHPDYVECCFCGTARSKAMATTCDVAVEETESGLYGSSYWDRHQIELGSPKIEVRARRDMTERCLHWLGAFLRYRLPPASVLEIGCAHGGFVHLLGQVGFSAVGMEMSPGIVRQAEQRFGVRVLQGPIERVKSQVPLCDAVFMLDVLEHLHQPLMTMSVVAERLADDGVVIIQSPLYSREWALSCRYFLPHEHTYMFSKDSVKRLLSQLGFTHIHFQPALFPEDMFLFCSRKPMSMHAVADVENALLKNGATRLVLALLDMYEEKKMLEKPLSEYGVRLLGSALGKATAGYVRKLLGRHPVASEMRTP